MKIISWNVNGIRAAEKKGFCDFAAACGADVICVQETKARREQISPETANPRFDGGRYFSHFFSAARPGYSGTAIFSKREPDRTFNLGISKFDDEGRVAACDFENLTVISAYFPNSQDGLARIGYKIEFCEAIQKFCEDLVAQGRDILLCGDFNVAHEPIDIARPEQNEGSAGYSAEERDWMTRFLGAGFCDTFRALNPQKVEYSWWSYRFHAREKNIGWRLDYHCVNQRLFPAVKSSRILTQIQGSDHCPIEISLEIPEKSV